MGRVRTEGKRDEILRVASELFQELGYEGCSMTTISERLGGAKGTLYGYFPSKESLLRALRRRDETGQFARMLGQLHQQADLRDALIRLGIAFQRERLSSLPVGNIRAMVSRSAGSPIAREFYDNVISPAFSELASQFQKLMDAGRIRRADPWVVLMYWKGLNDWDIFERRLIGAIRGPEDVDSEKIATLPADAFLTLYGVE